MSETNFDVVFIGSGPGGYIGAIRCAQLGFKTAVVEKGNSFGGTCLNVGCIPSKALLESSEQFSQAQHNFDDHGLEIKELKLNLSKMMNRKSKIVEDLTQGISYLFKKNNIASFLGWGKLKSPNEVTVTSNNKEPITLNTRFIVLATGSVPNELPFLKYDSQKIISSTEALSLEKVPSSLTVIGGGAIGLEMASVWARLGSEVTVIEYTDKICGTMDKELSQKMLMILKKQNIQFILNAKVVSAEQIEKKLSVSYESVNKKGVVQKIDCEKVLVAVGRRPFSKNLNLEALNISTDKNGFVLVNEHWQTQCPNIFAIGDLIPGPMLAHKAEEEGVAVAEIIAGQAGHVNYSTVPSVIYTWPEAASVGKTEDELKQEGTAYKSGKFPFTANGRAKALGMTEGFVKVLADKTTDQILGVHILGPRASDLISEAVICMEFSGSAEDLARSFHAHPTLSEVVREAALNVDKNARQM